MAYGWGWSTKKFFKSDLEYFFKCWKAERDREARQDRKELERLRLLGSWVLAPYSKGLTPQKIMPLPWDAARTKEQFLKDNKDLIPVWDKLSK